MNLLRIPQFLLIGTKNFGVSGFQRAQQLWDPPTREATDRDASDLHVMVTGANQGLGFQVALELARRHANVALVCRNKDRGLEALQKIQEETGNSNLSLHVCDVSSLNAVRALVAEYEGSGKPLDCLVNNAGVLINESRKSEDGFEVNFATNTLGTYALTTLLLPLLRKSSKGERSLNRVITVTSGGMLTSHLEVDDLELKKARTFDGTTQYARDKRRQVAMTEHWAASNPDLGFYTVHPGWTATEGVKKSIPGFYSAFEKEFRPLEQGADGIVYLALEDSSRLKSGGFYLDRLPQSKHLPLGFTGYSAKDAQRLCLKLGQLAKL